jgi:hypothetical protein
MIKIYEIFMKRLCEEAEMNLRMFSGTVLEMRGTRDTVAKLLTDGLQIPAMTLTDEWQARGETRSRGLLGKIFVGVRSL